MMTVYERHGRMLVLMRSFPALASIESGDSGWGKWLNAGWNPKAIDRWADLQRGGPIPSLSSSALAAVQFVLATWSGQALHKPGACPWKVGGFDVMDALKTWDHVNRAAFLAFSSKPEWT